MLMRLIKLNSNKKIVNQSLSLNLETTESNLNILEYLQKAKMGFIPAQIEDISIKYHNINKVK